MRWRRARGSAARPVEPPSEPRNRDQARTFVLGALLALAWCTAALFCPDGLERAENALADWRIGLMPAPSTAPAVAVVEVDEPSLRALGQWPWPRYQVSRLLEAIGRAGPAAVAVDTLFAERDRTSPAEIASVLQRDFNQTLTLDGIAEPLRDYDRILATTLADGPFVLGYFFSFDRAAAGTCVPKAAAGALLTPETDPLAQPQFHRATGALCNIPILNDAAGSAGFTNGQPDTDGIYRRTPLVIEWNGRLYPSLALQTYLTALGLTQFAVEPTASGLRLHLGQTRIPLDASGNLLLRSRAAGHRYPSISAADVVAGTAPPDALRGKVVLIGFSATGLHEYRPTPYDPLFTGVQLHAAVLDNLQQGDPLQRPVWGRAAEAALALALGLALSLVLAKAGPTASALFPAVLVLAVLGTAEFLLLRLGLVASPVLPVATVLIVLLALSLLKFGREYLQTQRLARQIADGQDAIIEGFCAMSEHRDPETGFHIRRTQNYVKALALHLQHHPRFQTQLDDATIELLYKTAPLHDIGKIGIRDHILLKPDRLTDEEFAVMKTHTTIGGEVVRAIMARMGANAFLEVAEHIILGHQEKWDGSGYPQALKGEEIPLAARLMAIADVYDALISRRVYKPGLPHQTAVDIIAQGRGAHFDPELVDAFLEIHPQFRDIALQFLDSDEQRQTLLGDPA